MGVVYLGGHFAVNKLPIRGSRVDPCVGWRFCARGAVVVRHILLSMDTHLTLTD
jgi:hypothetical protein